MKRVEVGWALVGKHPGTYDDYSVIGCSAGPFNRRQFEKIVFTANLGNPPAQDKGPSALPWVWFDHPQIRNVTYVGVAIRVWSEHFDATNRPILLTRYFCVAVDDLLDLGMSYSDLHRTVAGQELGWENLEPFSQPLLSLEVKAGGRHADLPTEVAAAAAARLCDYDGSVTLLNGPAGVGERIAVLDAVARLLPAGAKAWLGTGTWSENASASLNLVFAKRPRDNDLVIDLRTLHIDRTRSGEPSQFERKLTEFAHKFGAGDVADHLATLTAERSRDPYAAETALVLLDLAADVHARALHGGLAPKMVRALFEAGKFEDLDQVQRRQVLDSYLSTADAADLAHDRHHVAAHWSAKLGPRLDEFVRGQAKAGGWRADDIVEIAELARRVGRAETFIDDLIRLSPLDPHSSAVVAAERLAGMPEWGLLLADRVAGSPPLLLALVPRLAVSGQLSGPFASELDARGSETPWSRMSGAYRLAFSDRPADLGSEHLVRLSRVDQTAVAGLVDFVRANRPEASEAVVDAVLSWLVQYPSELGRSWLRLLDTVKLVDGPGDRRAAAVDFLRCYLGVPPRWQLARSAVYRKDLAAYVLDPRIAESGREKIINALVLAFADDWAAEPRSFGEVMDFFWQIVHRGSQPLNARSLVDRVAAAVDRDARLIDSPVLDRWRRHLVLNSRLNELLNRRERQTSGLGEMRAVAAQMVKLAQVTPPNDQIRAHLARSRMHPDSWGAFLVILAAELRNTPVSAGTQLITTVVNSLLESRPGGTEDVGCPDSVLAAVADQVELMSAVLNVYVNHAQSVPRDGALADRLQQRTSELEKQGKKIAKKDKGALAKLSSLIPGRGKGDSPGE